MKFPSGNFHCLILSGDAEAKEKLEDLYNKTEQSVTATYSVGWSTTDRTLFLWLVKTAFVLPAAKSHNLMVLSCDPVITYKISLIIVTTNSELTCGLAARHLTQATVLV